VPWLRRLAAGLPTRRPEFDPGSVHVGFVVDKVALGQGFLEYFGLPLPISFRRCSITRKKNNNNKLHHMVAQEALRLCCVCSICCGVLLHKKLNHGIGFYGVAFPSNASTFCPLQAVSPSYILCSIVSPCHTPTLKFHGPPPDGRKNKT
jgi:hypothetical protein